MCQGKHLSHARTLQNTEEIQLSPQGAYGSVTEESSSACPKSLLFAKSLLLFATSFISEREMKSLAAKPALHATHGEQRKASAL